MCRASSSAATPSPSCRTCCCGPKMATQGVRPGAAPAPAHTLYDIVRKLREGAQIELESAGDKGAMTLRSGRSTFTLACLPPEDYPLMTGGDLAHGFTVSAIDLKR